MKGLVELGAVIKRKKRWTSPMHHAANHGNAEMIKSLARAGADVNAQNRDGATAVYCAVASGHVKMVRLLVGLGASLTLASTNGTIRSMRLPKAAMKERCVR